MDYNNIDIIITGETDAKARIVSCDSGLIWDFVGSELVDTFSTDCVLTLAQSSVYPGFDIPTPKLPSGQYMVLINYTAGAVSATTVPDVMKKFYTTGEGVIKLIIADVS